MARGWSVFSREAAIKPEQKLSGRGHARPKPDTASDVQSEHPQDDRLSRGMTDYYQKVCCFIEAQSEVLMGIWGVRGVGKTTLLRFVHDSYNAVACFDHIMFVGAGTGNMVRNVQHAISINLGLDWRMMSLLDELSPGNHIFDHLQHKSFLLLLDDIREPLNWWAIGLPLLLHRRQKIILATRSQAACALMGCDELNTMEMRCLGEFDAWKLFSDKVKVDDRPLLRHLAHQMVTRCGGLPLALCSLGRAMSNKRDPSEWRCAYNQLRDMRLEPCEIDDKVGTLILNPPCKKISAKTEYTSLQEIAPSQVSMLLVKGSPRDTTSPININEDAKQQVTDKSRKGAKSLTETYTSNTSLVAVLIATINFSAVYTTPSDAESEGPHIICRKFAFLTFTIGNTLSLCSSCAVVLICMAASCRGNELLIYYRSFTEKLMWFSCVATIAAFSTALYIVLAPRLNC